MTEYRVVWKRRYWAEELVPNIPLAAAESLVEDLKQPNGSNVLEYARIESREVGEWQEVR